VAIPIRLCDIPISGLSGQLTAQMTLHSFSEVAA